MREQCTRPSAKAGLGTRLVIMNVLIFLKKIAIMLLTMDLQFTVPTHRTSRKRPDVVIIEPPKYACHLTARKLGRDG